MELGFVLESGELTQGQGEGVGVGVVYWQAQAWKAILNWLGLLFRVFSDIIGGPFITLLLLLLIIPSTLFLSLDNTNTNNIKLFKSHPISIRITAFSKSSRSYLDETLICAYERASFPVALRNQAIKAGLNWFDLDFVTSHKEVEKPKINYVTIFECPGLKEFLRQLSEFADLVLFTAGLEGYASPLVDRIDTENWITRRLYRASTINTEYREHVKDLSCISKNLCRIVIVDNNPFSFLLQPDNGIPCIPFSAEQPHDTQLLDIILPLLKHLSKQKDVRHVLYEMFNMPGWFQKQGIPASR